jgi:zinc transporter ZupT
MAISLVAQAFLWGLASAASLPLGSLVAFRFKISKRTNAMLLAFGAGALLFALAIEIFGEAIFNPGEPSVVALILLGVGAIFGAVIFYISNYFIANQGGFLRNFSLRSKFLHKLLKKEVRRRQTITQGLLNESRDPYGQPHSILHSTHPNEEIDPMAASSSPTNRKPTLRKTSRANSKRIPADEYDDLGISDSEFNDSSQYIQDEILRTQMLLHHSKTAPMDESDELNNFETTGWEEIQNPKAEMEKLEAEFLEKKNQASVGVAIWLGILIDGIPESLVIGLLTDTVISYTFIVGVLISNFPEAMSSTIIMHKGGLSKTKIFLMWFSIMIITGAGAALGAFVFAGPVNLAMEISERFVAGLSSGAMLVMISETALPEAFHLAGNIVGGSTLAGFLAAFAIKLLELFGAL